MMILYVVPPLKGDRIDDNHIRVEHHHSNGLTSSLVMIDGVVREVRSTSSIDRNHPLTRTSTIIVHLKPLPKPFATRLQCAHLPAHQILTYVKRTNHWPRLSDYRVWLSLPDFHGERLILRKQRTLVNKGYVNDDGTHPIITRKGLGYLENVYA